MIKNILNFCLLTFLLSSCSDDDVRQTVSLNTSPTLTSPTTGNSYTFTEAEADLLLEEFKWTAADFGYQAAINYRLELGRGGNNFTPAINLGTTNELDINDITIGKINNLMIAAFGVVDTINATTLEYRVCASVSSEIESLCSEAITMNIVPFPVVIIYDSLSVPGNYQGWDPASRENVVFSRKNDGFYSGYVYFNLDDALYKFAQGWSWDVNWGDDDPADGTLDEGGLGNDIAISNAAGMYYLECDLNTLTHSNTKTNWGILGSATPTGDSEDSDFTWDSDRMVLSINIDLMPGEIRFRANDEDVINFGDTFTNGRLDQDGDGIPISEAGNYTIDLILNVGDYTYSITKN